MERGRFSTRRPSRVLDIRPIAHTGLMTRCPDLRMTDVYPPADHESIIVSIPDGERHAGSWQGEIRARLLDEETQNWFFELWLQHRYRRELHRRPSRRISAPT
jgi:hypothetical protein